MENILQNSLGNWTGTKKLWLAPGEQCRECDINVTVSETALGRCAVITYDWVFEGERQEGLLVFNSDSGKGNVQTAWVDSFHNANGIMLLKGRFTDLETIDVMGSYKAPTGPDWGWRIVLNKTDENTIKILNYNVTPGGEEMLAIEVVVTAE